jgi:hypothetical protein
VITDDIQPEWLNVIRRLQSVACRQRGYAIVSLQVMVDEHGQPVFWTEPTLTKLEPQRRAQEFLARIISGMPSK